MGVGWGGAWILGSGPTAGMFFGNTGNRGAYSGDCQPGPDLWISSVLAFNEATGALIWGFQTMAHDPYDWDCSWWQATGNETISGVQTPVIFKTCKDGILFELNALTGSLIWSWIPSHSMVPRGPMSYPFNPLNQTLMDSYFCGQDIVVPCVYAPTASGGYENTGVFNPATNNVYLISQTAAGCSQLVLPTSANSLTESSDSGGCPAGLFPPQIANSSVEDVNVTAADIDAATGKCLDLDPSGKPCAMTWSYFQAVQGFRGGLVSTGGTVIIPEAAGYILVLNALTGAVIKNIYIGGLLDVTPSIGATAAGQEEVIFPIGGGLGGSLPGDIVALKLNIPPSVTLTATSTSTATATSTATVASATTVTIGTSTVTVGAGQTSTITQSGTVTTVTGPTTTVAATTTTVTSTATSTSTSSTGVNSTTLYGIAAVAVIFIVATGYLAMRGRKPAS